MSFPLTINLPEDGVDGNKEVEKAQVKCDSSHYESEV